MTNLASFLNTTIIKSQPNLAFLTKILDLTVETAQGFLSAIAACPGYKAIPLLAIGVVLSFLVLDWIGIIGPAKIKNLPCVFPSAPIVGNLFQVLSNPSLQYSKWAEKYGDVYQIRMGTRRVVIANSYDSVKELWIKNKDSNNSRPVLYTFHSVVSSTQGFTIGTTPFGDSYKRKKKVVAVALSKKNVEAFSEFIDSESRSMFKRLDEVGDRYQVSKLYPNDVDCFKILQGFVLRVSLYLTYGYLIKVDHEDKCKLLDEISHVENQIVRLRGHSSNLQDYLPILRFLPNNNKNIMANDLRKRRDVYMNKFIDELKHKISVDKDFKGSIGSRVERNDDGSSNGTLPKVSSNELKSVFLTMVSAGLDNTPLVLNHILGHLSQPEYGAILQNKAMQAIREAYNNDLKVAYNNCPYEFKVDYIEALIKEGLRYYSVLPTSLPRQTTKDIVFRDCLIPSGTIMFMNTFHVNHDLKHFPYDPFTFNPSRFLDEKEHKLKRCEESTTMFTFGAGSRMCSGAHLAIKEIYISLIRFIILYEIKPPSNAEYLMELDPFKLNSVPGSVAIEPEEYRIGLYKRNKEMFE